MLRWIPLASALVVIGIGVIAQGYLSERWGERNTRELMDFSARVRENAPRSFGNWTSISQTIDIKQIEGSAATEALSLLYTNSETGESVSLFLTVGRALDMAGHTPIRCYPSTGYDIKSEQDQKEMDYGLEAPVQVSVASFSKPDMGQLLVHWTFSYDGEWVSPRVPQPFFGSKPALYKVYLITPVRRGQEIKDSATSAHNFAREFFPVLQEALFPPGWDEVDDE